MKISLDMKKLLVAILIGYLVFTIYLCMTPGLKEKFNTINSIPEVTTMPTEKPTEKPTEMPTEKPTEMPTETPTEKPTETPTEKPTEMPTEKPTEMPTEMPTEKPTEIPTQMPTEKPTEKPDLSNVFKVDNIQELKSEIMGFVKKQKGSPIFTTIIE